MKHIIILILSMLATSVFAQDDSNDLKIRQIDDGVYVHTSYKNVHGYGLVDSNGLVVVDAGEAFIVDTPWSKGDTEALLTWIRKQGFEVKLSISSHYHEDRTAGIELLNSKKIPTYASQLTNSLLAREGKPTATTIFDRDEFVLREGVLEVLYPGPGHTQDNLVVWLPNKGILFGGCLVRSLEWDGLGYTGDASIESWADSVAKVKERYSSSIVSVVPGHGEIGSSRILDHTVRLAKAASNESIQSAAKASAD